MVSFVQHIFHKLVFQNAKLESHSYYVLVDFREDKPTPVDCLLNHRNGGRGEVFGFF